MGASITEIIATHAASFPEKACIIDKNGVHTYGTIWEETKKAAHKLCSLQLKKNDCIMVECTQDAEFLICNFACELIGAIFVPIEHNASLNRVKNILSDTDARLFICKTPYDIQMNKIDFDTFFREAESQCGDISKFPNGDETAQILYTTGTTGASKGIEITHRNNIALAENIKYGTEMKPTNVELIPLPISHSHGLRCCYANFLNKSTIVLVDGMTNVKHIYDLMDQYKITSMDLSPSATSILLKLSKNKLYEYKNQIDYIQIGTAILPENIKDDLISKLPSSRLYNFYGSTESGRTCVLDFNKERGKIGCIGKPTKNARFIVTDDNRKEIISSKEHIGLLASAGAMNMKGYWKHPKLTEEIMHDGYVYTNDMGFIDEDGFIYVFSRKDDIINYKGIKIAPDEIEENVKKYPEIIDCACVPKPDKMSGQIPKLFVVVRNKENFQKTELLKFLKAYIDGNQMPKEIEVIDQIPRTYNGKIQRKKLIDNN